MAKGMRRHARQSGPATGTSKDRTDVLGALKALNATAKSGERRVSELTRVGTFTKPYELLACVRAYVDFLREEQGTLKTERTRLTKLKGDLLDLEYKQKSKELVRMDIVEREWFALTRTARDGVQNIPSRV